MNDTDMKEFYQNNTSPSGYPEGFEGTIDERSQNVMPTLTPTKNIKIDPKLIGIIAGSILAVLCVILLLFTLFKPKKADEGEYRKVAEKFVEALDKEDESIFEPYIYKDSNMDGFMDKVLARFKDSEISDAKCTFDDESKSADIELVFIQGDVTYKTVASIETKLIKNAWYLYSCSFSDFDVISETTEELASPTEAEERTLVNVGTDMSGHFDVPGEFTLSSLSLPSTENISYEYTLSGVYQDKTESVSVIVYSEAQPLQSLAETLSQSLFGAIGEIVLENDKGGDVYRETRNTDGVITEVRTFLGADGIARAFVVKYVEGDELVRGLWQGYSLPSGLIVEPTPTDATQVIGSETMGTLEIPGTYAVNGDYSAEGMESVGYSLDEKVVVLMNYAGTDKANIPLNEFAESIKAGFLGEKGSEISVKEDFPGALYSFGVGEDGVMSEMYVFRGNDDNNRLMLLIHKQDDTDTAALYHTYNLPVGVKGIE